MTRALAVVIWCLALPLQAQELLMYEERGCYWCARWNEDIGQTYPKTDEGRLAPLRRVDIDDPVPDDLKSIARVTYTPTFILFHDGAEVGRIEGYPGEDFFWGLLGRMLKDMEKDPAS